jgi:molybdate transport system substrate-binding protein
MRMFRPWMLVFALLLAMPAKAEKITVAVAASFRPAMDEIVTLFRQENTGVSVETVYGASGKFATQIRQGAPYDLFFSADMMLPRTLAEAGFAASEVRPYALGRIVLWSAGLDVSNMALESLADDSVSRIAIANPRHAPYGQRAEETLRAAGVWSRVERKLVYGESIAHAAQFAQSGNAQVGIIALSQAVGPELVGKGSYRLVPASLHQPLEQGFIITRRAQENALAKRFAEFIGGKTARGVIAKYGFALPER